MLQAGLVTLRFNFRGVQGSQGQRTGGLHEPDDVRGAVTFMVNRMDVDSSRLYLVGDSFGAAMALQALRDDERVAGVACIVLPLGLLQTEPVYLRSDRRPKFFVVAEHDQFCDLDTFTSLYKGWAAPKDMLVLAGSDHFLGVGPSTDPVNRSREIASAVVDWVRRTAPVSY